MNLQFRLRSVWVIGSLVLNVSVISGCEEQPANSAVSTSQVDPWHASPEALVEYFNSLVTTDPINYRGYVAAIYAENDLQRRLVSLYSALPPVLDLSTAVRDRFNDTIVPDSDNFSSEPIATPAHITERTEGRVQATYTEFDGKKATLYLVRIGEQWWISGYTMEYDPLRPKSDESLAFWETVVDFYAAVAPNLTRRVRAGEFDSVTDFRNALGAAVRDLRQQRGG